MYLIRPASLNTDRQLVLHLPDTTDYQELIFFPEKSVAMWILEDGIPEKNLIDWFLETYVRADKDFLDIGAHVGTYSWTCGRRANHTHAFECNRKVFCYLAANIALHGLEDKITPHSCALGSEEGFLDYYTRSEDGGSNGVKVLSERDSHLPKQRVSVRTLDSFHFTNIGCIKIDVEGFEKEVLLGSMETLKVNHHPPILFESWGDWKESEGVPSKKIRAELFEFIESIGYRIVPLTYKDMFIAEFIRS